MAFFDSLGDFIGDASKLAAGEINKRRRKTDQPLSTPGFEGLAGSDTRPRDPSSEFSATIAPKPSGPTQVPGMISEERSKKLQAFNAKKDDVKNRAIKVVERAIKDATAPGRKMFHEGIIPTADPIYSAQIGQISQTARDIIKSLGIDTVNYENDIRQLEQLESNAKREEEMTPSEPYVPGEAKLADVQARVLKAQNDLKYAVTGEQVKALQATIDSGLKILKSAEESGDKFKNTTFDGGGETPEAKAASDAAAKASAEAANRNAARTGDDGTPGRDSPLEVFGTLSLDGRKEFATQAKKALEKVGLAIPFRDPLQKVAFYVALPAYAKALGDETYNRVIRPFAGIDREAEAFEKRARGEQTKQEEAMTATANERRQKVEEAKRAVNDIANLDVMNTPLGVIGFILTSLVLGPRMSSFLFSRAAARGKLEAELKLIVGDIKDLRDKESQHFRMSQEASGRALDSAFRFGAMKAEAGERRESDLQSRINDHYYRVQEMRERLNIELSKATGEKKDLLKQLGDSFERSGALARRYEAHVDRYRKEIADIQEKIGDPTVPREQKLALRKRQEAAQKQLEEAMGLLGGAEERMDGLDRLLTPRLKSDAAR